MNMYDRNSGKSGRKPNLWVRYSVAGKEYREPGKGSQRATAAFMAELQRQIKLGIWVPPQKRNAADPLFADYAIEVVNRRVERGVATADKDERGHVVNHLVPVFGALRMREVASFAVVKKGFAEHINRKNMAGRTVRNIHATLRQIFAEAEEDGLIDTAPSPLKVARDHIPPPIDKDPAWRSTAKFEPSEVVQLIGCSEIPSFRRAMYATYFLTGSRFVELLPLNIRDYNRQMRPLPCLSVMAAKLGRHKGQGLQRRHVPVTSELQAWLDWWLDSEYEVMFGAKPKPGDPLFPTTSERRRNRGLERCSYHEIVWWWREHDLPAAGLQSTREPAPGAPNRGRGLHDARRTLIGILRSAGVDDRHVRSVTHGGTGDTVLDAYTHWAWAALCESLGVVKLGLPPPPTGAQVFALDSAAERRQRG